MTNYLPIVNPETYSVTETMRDRINRFIQKVEEERPILSALVEESEVIEAEAATSLADKLRERDLKGLTIGLIHGKMKWKKRKGHA